MIKGNRYYLKYTLLFVLVSFLVVGVYLCDNNTLIWLYDGWAQHYKAYLYYSKYLRFIIKSAFSGNLVVPQFEFTIGEGSDIIQSLSYYVIGDPFAILCMLVPEKYMSLYYDFMIIVRLYLSGLFFSKFCFRKGYSNSQQVLCGSMIYAFCSWNLAILTKHPAFLNPMVCLPLILMGIEDIFSQDKPHLFIASVAITALCNFYLFYMIALTIALYIIIKILFCKIENREKVKLFLKILFYAIIGTLIGAVLLVPNYYFALCSERVSTEKSKFSLLYQKDFYSKFLPSIISPIGENWAYLGFAAPSLIALLSVNTENKRARFLRILLAVSCAMLLMPLFGKVFNGFSYSTNRWSFSVSLLVAFGFVAEWDHLHNLSKKELAIIAAELVVYFIICILCNFKEKNIFVISFLIAFISFAVIAAANMSKLKWKFANPVLLIAIVISICINNIWYCENNSVRFFLIERNEAYSARSNESVAVAEAAGLTTRDPFSRWNSDIEFFRYSGKNLTYNAGMLGNISSTNYYWSMLNDNISNYNRRLNLPNYKSFKYSDYDDRSTLLALASVKFFVRPIPQPLSSLMLYYPLEEFENNASTPPPYGFELLYQDEKYNQVYSSEYVLPIGYSYSAAIEETEWDSMTAVQKQDCMLNAVVLNDKDYEKTSELIGNISFNANRLNSKHIPFSVEYDRNELLVDNNSISVLQDEASITFNFEGEKDSETYLTINGLKYDGYSNVMMKGETEQGAFNTTFYLEATTELSSKSYEYRTKDDAYYNGKSDYTFCSGYSEHPLSYFTITFPQKGVYSFDNIIIESQPMADFRNKLETLKKNTFSSISFGVNEFTGTIDCDEPTILCLTIPYSKGWSAFVDGQRTEIMQANIKHMALNLGSGTHEIVLKYETPTLKIGAIVSGFGIVLWIAIAVTERKNRTKHSVC